MDEEIKNHISSLEKRVQELESQKKEKKIAIILQSGTLDRVMSAMILAIGAASLNYSVTIFCTFWGLNVLKTKKIYKGKKFAEKIMTFLGPQGPQGLPITHHNFFGLGAAMMRQVIRDKGCASAEELLTLCQEYGIKIFACDTTCQIMNVQKEELKEGIEHTGVVSFFDEALKSSLVFFI